MEFNVNEMADSDLVGHIGGTHSPTEKDAALAELQKRNIEATRVLTTAVQAAGDCTATQNTQMFKLTTSMKTLTWVVIGLAVVQIVIAIVTRGG